MAARNPVNQQALCGLSIDCVTDLAEALASAKKTGYFFITIPIAHPRFKREFHYGKAKYREGSFTRSDLILSSQDWNRLICGKISPWINVDSSIPKIRKNSESALHQELLYASHLTLTAIFIPLRNGKNYNLARFLYNYMIARPTDASLFWITVPLQSPARSASIFLNTSDSGDATPENMYDDTWEWWNSFRTITNTEFKFGVALEMTADLPPEEHLDRWLGEPVRCVIVSTNIFITNKKGYPVLSRMHQGFIRKLFKLNIQIIITGVNRHAHLKLYQQYIDHLGQTQPPDDPLTRYSKGWEDYLQTPLQPLMDNLESYTYEVFEKDPIKYTQYQRAIYEALLDKAFSRGDGPKEFVIMVLGAGRGPLVRAALTAAERAESKVRIYAVEKNPNAVVTLYAQKEEMWKDRVVVVNSDMREWDPPEKADIVVSELLGSFGDNELSPECLDGAQKFLHDDGISIPQSYTSYIAPLQSAKLYSEVASVKDKEKPGASAFETPYVVRLHNSIALAPPKKLFTFYHPNRDPMKDNSRYGVLSFDVKNVSTLHGFAGYFDTVLYRNITLSIVPETHTQGLFSWFPILFPIKEPIFLPASSKIEVHFWRSLNKRNVWYEWLVTKPVVSSLHNPSGRSYTIGLI